MKRQPTLAILTLSTAILLAGAFAAGAQEQKQAAHPRATVVDSIKDFGKVAKGAELNHDFLIKNEGKAPLRITRVTPACGCTVASFDREIAPGKTGKVHATIDTSTLAGPTARGIAVYTDDPENRRLNLTFKANVVPYLKMHPGYARYMVVQGEKKPGIVKQTVWSADDSEFEVVGIESPWPYLTASYRPASPSERIEADDAGEGEQWIVELDLDYNQAPIGPLAEHLKVVTSHPKQREILVPVSGFVRPTLWATPDEVAIGTLPAGEPVEISLTVQNFLSTPLEITEVTSSLGEVEDLVTTPIVEGHKYQLAVLLHPQRREKGPFSGTLRIHTSSPDVPVLEVPFEGRTE